MKFMHKLNTTTSQFNENVKLKNDDYYIISENINHSDYLKRTMGAFIGVFVIILLILWKGVPGTDIPVDFAMSFVKSLAL